MDFTSEDTGHHLVPSRSHTLTSRGSISQEPRKRKRYSLDLAAPSDWFDAIVESPPLSCSKVSFSPIATVLRAHLPLAWLGSGCNSNLSSPVTVLRASIPNVSRWDYQILIARQIPNGALHAIERVGDDLYVCHVLRSWVKEKWIEQATIGAAPPVDVELLIKPLVDHGHSRKPSTSSIAHVQGSPITPCSPRQPNNHRGVLARKSILDRSKSNEVQSHESDYTINALIAKDKDIETLTSMTIDSQIPEPKTTDERNHGTEVILEQGTVSAVESCRTSSSNKVVDILTNESSEIDQLSPDYLRRRYLETLYLSKISVAFYAKGPLSRTRARARAIGSSMPPEQLLEFYRQSILPAKKLDLKYKDSIKSKILTLMVASETINLDEEGASIVVAKQKKRRKTKLGKDALWPVEDEFIEKWWRNRDHNNALGNSSDVQTQLKDALSRLRMRETELQIVLMLEVMALEARADYTYQSQGTIAPTNTSSKPVEPRDQQVATARPLLKRTQSLQSDLESLLDRLCIWHSVDSGEVSMSSNKDQASNHDSSSDIKDRLRDFTKDVVMPFYGSKLPDQCKFICKKLGSSDSAVPQRPTLGRERSAPGTVPGTAINLWDRSAGKRTLERVLSEDQALRHASPPVLSRAATVPSAPVFKREPSECHTSRIGMHKSASFSNREIDLVADARSTAAKRRKLDTCTAQKKELERAIEALKKPNRSVTANTFMDEVEKRTFDKRSTTRRIEPVQITATPRHNRSSRPVSDDCTISPMPLLIRRTDDNQIPLSTSRFRGIGRMPDFERPSAKKKAVLSAIHDTPSRQGTLDLQASYSAAPDHSSALSAGSTAARSLVIDATPVKCRTRQDLYSHVASTPEGTQTSHRTTLFRSMESPRISVMASFKDAPEISEGAGRAMDRVMRPDKPNATASIYESLGWDDEYTV